MQGPVPREYDINDFHECTPLCLRFYDSSILRLSALPCPGGLGTITNRFSMLENPYTNVGSACQVASGDLVKVGASPEAASAAVEL